LFGALTIPRDPRRMQRAIEEGESLARASYLAGPVRSPF